MKFVKYFVAAVALQLSFLTMSSFASKPGKSYTELLYYVVVAHEGGHHRSGQPVISNVVYVSCKYHNGLLVSEQFNTYYVANYSAFRNHKGLVAAKTFSYNSKELAEGKRKEIVADFSRKRSPLLTSNFSVKCD